MFFQKWSAALCVLLHTTFMVTQQSFCPPQCTCNETLRQATCGNLSFIPKLPDYVRHLRFKNNKFLNVTYDFLSVLRKIDIQYLKFFNNSIQHMSSDAFVDFTSLRTLLIEGEMKLKTDEVTNAIQSLRSYKLNLVSLAGNNLRNFSVMSLSSFKNLNTFTLSGNEIVMFELEKTIYVKKLFLNKNNIFRLPNFCLNETTSKVPNLETLSMKQNALFELSSTDFKCLFSLKRLNLDNNRFIVLDDNVFMKMNRLESLSLQQNMMLKTIAPFAFNSSSIKRLHIGYIRFHFNNNEKSRYNSKFDADYIFKQTPELEFLDMTNNFLPNNDTTLERMFRPLNNLTDLILQATGLQALPQYGFSHLSSLKKLVLSGNYINDWTNGCFDNLTNLRYLNMAGNIIRLVTQSSIPENVLSKLTHLSLADNFFTCTCDLKWFRDWIRGRNKSAAKIINYPERYKCRFPEDMRDKLLQQYNPTEESCRPWNPLFTMAIILSAFGVLVLVIIFTAYNCHANIRNYFYLFNVQQRRRRGYLRLDSKEDFEYHAFIVYCDADREWVHGELLERFEDDGLKICVHHRDFDPGTAITENIDSFMNKCWKIVVVMSNEFAESAWCQWEVDLIQERRRKCGKEALVLIMLRTINASHMTSGIKTLLGTTPYLVYKKGIGEDIFWKAAIDGLRRPLQNPPMAV